MIKPLVASLLLFATLTPALPQQPTTPAPPSERLNPPAQPQKGDPQDPDESDVVRIRTNLVQIDAVVTRDGKQVTDLTAQDFEIFEDGKKQVITNFSYVSNVPSPLIAAPAKENRKSAAPYVAPAIRPEDPRRIVALVVDDLGLSTESMGPVRSQLRKFIDEQMKPNDLVAIIRTGGEVGALQQFTTDKRLLYRAVERLRRHTCSRMGSTVLPRSDFGGADLMGTSVTAGGISLCANNSLLLSARSIRFIIEGMGRLPGRKSLVLLSDHFPLTMRNVDNVEGLTSGGDDVAIARMETAGGQPTHLNFQAALKSIAELAIRSSVVIYAVDTRGVQATGVTAADGFDPRRRPMDLPGLERSVSASRSHQMLDGRAGAEKVAKETGGFAVRNSNDFQLPRVMSDQEGYYLIGYRPTTETFDRRFHRISARVKRPGFSVRTRDGFFGVTDEAARPPARTNQDMLHLALMSPFASADIDVQLTTLFSNTAVNGSQLHSFLYFQARDLTFTEEADGWRQAVFDLSAVIFGDNGTVAHQASETRTVRLKDEAYEEVLRTGLVYQLDLPVPKPGYYQFRAAVRDSKSSRLGSAGQFVEVPDLAKGQFALSGITVSGVADVKVTGTDHAPEKDRALMSGPGQRRFRTPSNLYFGYVIHNPQRDKTTQRPKLTVSMRILRDTKVIFEGQPKALDATLQSDLNRITAGGGVQLGTDMAPGEYVLQVPVTDLAGTKPRTSTQWIDFEIVK